MVLGAIYDIFLIEFKKKLKQIKMKRNKNYISSIMLLY